jgi:hypothetical protein
MIKNKERNRIMKKLKQMNKIKRLRLSVLVAVSAVVLTGAAMPQFQIKEKTLELAWWGTMYPEFCFGTAVRETETDNGTDSPSISTNRQRKVSFCLAKLLNWC